MTVADPLTLRLSTFGRALPGLRRVRKEKLYASSRPLLFKMINKNCKKCYGFPTQIPEQERRPRDARLKKIEKVPVQIYLVTS